MIALVITIVVLLILAGVTIAMLTGDNGILTQANKANVTNIEGRVREEVQLAVQAANLAVRAETAKNNSWSAVSDGILPTTAIARAESSNFQAKETNGVVLSTIANDLNAQGYFISVTAVETEGGEEKRIITVEYEGDDYKNATNDTNAKITYNLKVTQHACDIEGSIDIDDGSDTISTTESYVGYYADMNADGTVDGVIFADLAVGNKGSGQWGNEHGKYTIPTETGLKDYYVSKTGYAGSFGTKDILSPVASSTGKERFYIMSLSNFGGESSEYCWYYAASGNMSDYATATSGDFGTGKANTVAMIDKWNKGADGGYGAQNASATYKDIWGEIQGEVAKGWFVPSEAEWSAFAEELGITKEDYANYGLNDYYWSSSQLYAYYAWHAKFNGGYMINNDVIFTDYVRLATTF